METKTTKTTAPAPNHLAHFAIHADDVERAQRFYGKVFGWRFEAWGPPGFFMIQTSEGGDPGVFGSLHGRHHPLRAGAAGDDADTMTGFECTIAVADVDKTAKAVTDAGGTITMKRMTIGTVGHLVKFRDTEGNIVGAMQYDVGAK